MSDMLVQYIEYINKNYISEKHVKIHYFYTIFLASNSSII